MVIESSIYDITSVIKFCSISSSKRAWRGGEEGRVELDPTRTSLCLARVRATLIRLQSVSRVPTLVGRGEERTEGRDKSRQPQATSIPSVITKYSTIVIYSQGLAMYMYMTI